jgi:RHS repeat-associated protein
MTSPGSLLLDRSPLLRLGPERASARFRTQRIYLYYNGHGDLAAEADASGNRTALHTYTPFGTPTDTPPANASVHRYTGRWDKQLDTTSSLILMGARPYDSNLGRFLAVDPIDGGSLNNYDYAGQDPINGYDLDGRSWWCNSDTSKCRVKNDGDDLTTCWTDSSSETGWTCDTADHLTSAEKKDGASYAYDVTTTPAGGDYPSPSMGYHCVVYGSGREECDLWGDLGHGGLQHAVGNIICSPASDFMSLPWLGRFWGSLGSDTLAALGCQSSAR